MADRNRVASIEAPGRRCGTCNTRFRRMHIEGVRITGCPHCMTTEGAREALREIRETLEQAGLTGVGGSE